MKLKTILIGLYIGLESYFLSVLPGSFTNNVQGAKVFVPVISTLVTYVFTDFLLKRNWSRRKKIIVAAIVFVVTTMVSIGVSASIIYSQRYGGQ